MQKKDWFCKICDAQFRWLAYRKATKKEEEFYGEDSVLKIPETEKEWKEAELFTDLNMFRGEFYEATEVEDCCDSCTGKLLELGIIKRIPPVVDLGWIAELHQAFEIMKEAKK